MKQIIFLSLVSILLISATIYRLAPGSGTVVDDSKIHWYSIEEALAEHQKTNKKIFIDMYTDWCGWCKVMDKKTFTDPNVIRYLNEHFIAVKFNAEQPDPVLFNGRTYQYMPVGRRGVHGLAYELLDQRASYPSFVLLSENLTRIGIIKGYKAPEPFLTLMEEHLTL
ncbi:MAG: DUF255 domain-containing protein [Bacteroidota bacterium]